jgi:ribose transport system permease protein
MVLLPANETRVYILPGTALLQVLRNLVNLLGIPGSLNFAVMGAVILIGVISEPFWLTSMPA